MHRHRHTHTHAQTQTHTHTHTHTTLCTCTSQLTQKVQPHFQPSFRQLQYRKQQKGGLNGATKVYYNNYSQMLHGTMQVWIVVSRTIECGLMPTLSLDPRPHSHFQPCSWFVFTFLPLFIFRTKPKNDYSNIQDCFTATHKL